MDDANSPESRPVDIVKKAKLKSKFVGVTYTKSGKWCAALTHKGKRHTAGTFKTALEAAQALNNLCVNISIPLKNPSVGSAPGIESENPKKKRKANQFDLDSEKTDSDTDELMEPPKKRLKIGVDVTKTETETLEKLRQIRKKKGSLQKRITSLSEALENVVVQESFFMEELNKVRELKKKEEERLRKEREERKQRELLEKLKAERKARERAELEARLRKEREEIEEKLRKERAEKEERLRKERAEIEEMLRKERAEKEKEQMIFEEERKKKQKEKEDKSKRKDAKNMKRIIKEELSKNVHKIKSGKFIVRTEQMFRQETFVSVFGTSENWVGATKTLIRGAIGKVKIETSGEPIIIDRLEVKRFKNGKLRLEVTVGKKRPPNAYNTFMGAELKRLQKQNPSLAHAEIFKQAAANWSAQKSAAKSPPVQPPPEKPDLTHYLDGIWVNADRETVNIDGELVNGIKMLTVKSKTSAEIYFGGKTYTGLICNDGKRVIWDKPDQWDRAISPLSTGPSKEQEDTKSMNQMMFF